MKTIYFVGLVFDKKEIELRGQFGKQNISLDLKWADGMIGVMPVFKEMLDAINFADKKAQVYEVKTVENGEKNGHRKFK